MKFFDRAAAAVAALGTIDVAPNFELVSQDAKLSNQSTSNANQDPPAPSRSVILDTFNGAWGGTGFNQIFRPNSNGTFHTTFPTPPDFHGFDDFMTLELNLMNETLSFSRPNALAAVPNRGINGQTDVSLRGIPYLQVIDDVTNPKTGRADGTPSGIHFEPGLWMVVPALDHNPVQGQTLNRMASIPHGTTINAQGFEPPQKSSGAPNIPPVRITPFPFGDDRFPIPFASQNASVTNSPRLPQDLAPFIRAKTITQAILDDPNTVLRNHLKGQTVVDSVSFSVTTNSSSALVGGGVSNNAFLSGANGAIFDPEALPGPNAAVILLNATFYIETISWTVQVPALKQGQNMLLQPVAPNPNVRLPTFSVTAPRDISRPVNITATSKQIQYSQKILLNFGSFTWPHVSVNTLAPLDAITVPSSAFR